MINQLTRLLRLIQDATTQKPGKLSSDWGGELGVSGGLMGS